MSFLDLPVELRLPIYTYLLVAPYPIHTKEYRYHDDCDGTDCYSPDEMCHEWKTGLHPSILRANRQIHAEASPILYSRNRFQFVNNRYYHRGSADLEAFLARTANNVRYVRCVRLNFPGTLGDRWQRWSPFCTAEVIADEARLTYPGKDNWEAHLDQLDRLREACPALERIEFLIFKTIQRGALSAPRDGEATAVVGSKSESNGTDGSIEKSSTRAVDVLAARLSPFSCLKHIVISVPLFGIDDVNLRAWREGLSASRYGWTVETRVLTAEDTLWPEHDDEVRYLKNEVGCVMEFDYDPCLDGFCFS
jgi:hypothetical protein